MWRSPSLPGPRSNPGSGAITGTHQRAICPRGTDNGRTCRLRAACVAAVLFGVSASVAWADGLRPASALVYPIYISDPNFLTLVSVTNTSTAQTTRAVFSYVDAVQDPQNPLLPTDCRNYYRAETLTPADTITVLTRCHVAAQARGYLVVKAQDPQGTTWSHNHLVGSSLILNLGTGSLASHLPVPFESVLPEGTATDVDLDGRADFDGTEYEAFPADLQMDSFLAVANSRLTLAHLSQDHHAKVLVQLLIWNDNEFPLSAQFNFRCWFEAPLPFLSAAFTQNYLANNTPDDPAEFDVDCDGIGDFETGWARITGVVSTGGFQPRSNPPLLGAMSRGPLEAGRTLWGSHETVDGEL